MQAGSDMTSTPPAAGLAARRLNVYYLHIVPLAAGEAEWLELGSDLDRIVDTIVREQSLHTLLRGERRHFKYCQIEEEEAVHVAALDKLYYAGERTPVWKVIVPRASIYERQTILDCIERNAGRNNDKYQTALDSHPGVARFFTFSPTEIRPVDDTVFVIEGNPRTTE